MEKLKLIINCSCIDKLPPYCSVIGELPLINAVAIEIEKEKYESLLSCEDIKMVHKETKITAQLDRARKIVNADKSLKYTGKGITMAFLDTGISPMEDFTLPQNRIIKFVDMVNNRLSPYDDNGHGTHVAGIAAGNGYHSGHRYCGIAPESSIVAIKSLNADGTGNSIDVLNSLQWLIDNRKKYNIRIANLSIGSDSTKHDDPLVKAVEAVWDSGIVITIAAGNNGPANSSITSPGTSKKVITVGSSDDNSDVTISGNRLVNFSGRGPTEECVIKPDIVAPGANITSVCSGEISDKKYISLSGTSMSTPIVAGAISLLLEKEPRLCPDDVKYLLKLCATNLNFPQNQQGWGLLNIEKLLSMEVVYVR